MELIASTKFCINCVHHDQDKTKTHVCRRDQEKAVNLVTGADDFKGTVRNCRDERVLMGPTNMNPDPCMAEGKHFKRAKK